MRVRTFEHVEECREEIILEVLLEDSLNLGLAVRVKTVRKTELEERQSKHTDAAGRKKN